ncbi:MAG: hypothetical protein K8R50_11400 [Betaproteobacteria bacterium]|nr:hypothetical protein [Betaproteobacteria bacterium]
MIKKYFTNIKNESHSHKFFLYSILAICFLKLVLVGTNEIISIPNDSVNYVRQSLDSLRELGAPPGYPYWLALSASLGLPQRVAIEILYLFASAVVAFSLVRVTGRFFALLLLGVLIFLPATFFLFDHALSDGFFVCLTLIALALSIAALLDSDSSKLLFWVRLLILAFVLGWMLITRNEDYLVVGWIIWFVVCRYFFQKPNRQLKQMVREAALCSALLLLGAFSVAGSVSTFHFITKGVFARTIMTLPSHMELLLKLASIETKAPSINRVPITKAQRESAYLASPTLKRLREHIEDPKNMYQIASLRAGFPVGEIGAGWVWHVFNDAAFKELPNKTLKDLNEFYFNTNLELRQSFERGILNKGFVIHPLLGGNINGLLSRLSDSSNAVYRALFKSYRYLPDSSFESSLFDLACLRRTSLISTSVYSGQVQGWAIADRGADAIASAEVGVYEAKMGIASTRWFTTNQIARPDVIRGFTAEGRADPEVFGFHVILPKVPGDTIVMRYLLLDSSHLITPPLVVNKVSHIERGSAGRALIQGIDSNGRTELATPQNIRQKSQKWLADAFEKIAPALLSVIFVLAIISGVLQKRIVGREQAETLLLAVSILIAGLSIQRFLFYTLVDAVGWDVEVRYLTSALVLMVVLSGVLVSYSFHTYNRCIAILFQRN